MGWTVLASQIFFARLARSTSASSRMRVLRKTVSSTAVRSGVSQYVIRMSAPSSVGRSSRTPSPRWRA